MGALMNLTKKTERLTKPQIEVITGLVRQTRYTVRNQAIFLLSVRAGLRAKKISSQTLEMVRDADGQLSAFIHLRDEACKGRSERIISLNRELRAILEALEEHQSSSHYVIIAERSEKTSTAAIVNLFGTMYRRASLPQSA